MKVARFRVYGVGLGVVALAIGLVMIVFATNISGSYGSRDSNGNISS